MAAGLGGGDAEPPWFKLNLTAHNAVQGKTIAQSDTYSAQCNWP